MPECTRCGCDIPARRDCPYCGSGQGSDELARIHGLHRGIRIAVAIAALFGMLAFGAYVVPHFTYSPMDTIADARMSKARRYLREENAAAGEAVLKLLKKDVWVSGLPDAFLASCCHLRYEQTGDRHYLEAMEEHLKASEDKERSLPQSYFAAVYSAETGQLEKASEKFSSCHKTLTMPGHPWESFIDRGTVNGNVSRWRAWLGKGGANKNLARPPVLHGL